MKNLCGSVGIAYLIVGKKTIFTEMKCLLLVTLPGTRGILRHPKISIVLIV